MDEMPENSETKLPSEIELKRPFQFTILQLMILTAVIAMSLAAVRFGPSLPAAVLWFLVGFIIIWGSTPLTLVSWRQRLQWMPLLFLFSGPLIYTGGFVFIIGMLEPSFYRLEERFPSALFVGTILGAMFAVPYAIILRRKSDKAENPKPNQTYHFNPLALIAAVVFTPVIAYLSIKVPLAVLALITVTGGFFVVKKWFQGKRWGAVLFSGIVLYLDFLLVVMFIGGF